MRGRMVHLVMLLLVVSGSASAQAKPTCAVVPRSLAAMKDCYRALLVFSANGDDLRLKKQVAVLDGAADDMMDRFVLFTPIVPDGRRVSTPADSPYTILNNEEMKNVRAQFHIPPAEFTILLLDEDGHTMLRAAVPVSVERLNSVIDKTPQRQAEMLRPHAN